MLDPATISVRSAMSSPVIDVSGDAPLERAFELLRSHRIQCVVQEGKLAGIVSDRDLHRAMPSPLTGDAGAYDEMLNSRSVAPRK